MFRNSKCHLNRIASLEAEVRLKDIQEHDFLLLAVVSRQQNLDYRIREAATDGIASELDNHVNVVGSRRLEQQERSSRKLALSPALYP